MKPKTTWTLLMALILMSCQKYESDSVRIIGKYRWLYTVRSEAIYSTPYPIDTVFADTEFTIEYTKSGKFKWDGESFTSGCARMKDIDSSPVGNSSPVLDEQFNLFVNYRLKNDNSGFAEIANHAYLSEDDNIMMNSKFPYNTSNGWSESGKFWNHFERIE